MTINSPKKRYADCPMCSKNHQKYDKLNNACSACVAYAIYLIKQYKLKEESK